MEQADLDDIVQLAAVAARPRARGAGVRFRGPAAADAPEVADAGCLAIVAAEVQELHALLPVPRVLEQRSAEHAEHAREGRAAKRRAVAKQHQNNKLVAMETKLRVVQAISPAAASAVVGKSRVQLLPKSRAQLHIQRASMPRARSVMLKSQRQSQEYSLAVVSSALDSACAEWWSSSFGRRSVPESIANALKIGIRCRRTIAFACMWDETSQKFRTVKAVDKSGAKSAFGKLAHQIQVFGGAVIQVDQIGDGMPFFRVDPWFSKSCILDETSANYILEGLLRSLPFKLEPVEILNICRSADEFLFTATVDRASSNGLAGAWIAEQVAKLPQQISFYVEYCHSHGCAIVKSRSPLMKTLATALRSFTAWMRFARNVDQLKKEVRNAVSSSFQVRREPCPPDFADRGHLLVDNLYSADGEHLWRFDKKEQRMVPTEFRKQLDAFCKVATFSDAGKRWMHWCYVLPGSSDALQGKAIGSPCCQCRDQALDKTVAAVLELVTSRTWKLACDSRWTNVTSGMRRFCLANANGRVLVEALIAVKAHWGLDDGIEHSLIRQIAADRNEFPARNKLKLLRLVQTFASTSLYHMSIALQGAQVVDKVLAHLLGGPAQRRASLRTLAHPVASPIVVAQAQLLELLQNFSVPGFPERHTQMWELFALLGGKPDDGECRMSARRALLQLSCGITDVFELRMQNAPYSLLRMLELDVDLAEKDRVAEQFWQVPEACLPDFCKRMRKNHPKAAFKTTVLSTLEAFGACFASIDFAERAHAQMRHDLHTTGRGCDYLSSAQKLLVRQHVAEHTSRGGLDPATKEYGAVICEGVGLEDGENLARRRSSCPAHIAFANAKRQAWKALVAPNRPMTAAERQVMEERVSEDWMRTCADTDRLALVSQNRPASAAGASSTLVASSSDHRFSSHCGLSAGPSELLKPDTVVEAMRCFSSPSDEGHVFGGSKARRCQLKEQLHVSAPVSDRTGSVRDGYELMYGCFASKKNICRRHMLTPADTAALDVIVDAIKMWTNSLSKEQKDSAAELLAFTGSNYDGDRQVFAVALLVHAKESPKMQLFAECHVREGADPASGQFFGQIMDAYPFQVHIATRVGRMSCADLAGRGLRAVSFLTSDEVGLRLMRTKRDWKLASLAYQIDTMDESLLVMNVTGCAPAFCCTAAIRDRARVSASRKRGRGTSALDLGDPIAHGCAAAACFGVSSGGGSGSGPGPVIDVGTGLTGPLEELAAVLADEPDDVLEDLHLSIFEAHGLPPIGIAEGDGDALADDVDGDDIEEDDVAAALVCSDSEVADEDKGDDGPGESGASSSSGAASSMTCVERLIEATTIDDDGYVKCSIEPFASVNSGWLARITEWPRAAPIRKQNVAIQCYMHGGKCSAARGRHRFDNSQLLAWLFSGVPITDELDRARLQRDHTIRAVVML